MAQETTTPRPWMVGGPTDKRVYPCLIGANGEIVAAVRSGSNRPQARRDAALIITVSTLHSRSSR